MNVADRIMAQTASTLNCSAVRLTSLRKELIWLRAWRICPDMACAGFSLKIVRRPVATMRPTESRAGTWKSLYRKIDNMQRLVYTNN
jgi:hypothetical protein